MLKSKHYRALLNHRDHQLELIERNERAAAFRVLIQTRDNRLLGYEWSLERVQGGRYDGCWMTTGVSPPVSLGSAI